MTALTVVGGLYRERCTWPEWHALFGSGGRAAVAIAEYVDEITLQTYAPAGTAAEFRPQADLDRLDFRPQSAAQTISFEYEHCLATPKILPHPAQIRQHDPIPVASDVVLRFGMLEGTARINAECCIYDPQSAFSPEPFAANESRASRLAIVGNRTEICRLGEDDHEMRAAKQLLASGAEVVVVKSGPKGAQVITTNGAAFVPPHRTENVWTLGSGDVFAAMFAACWGVRGDDPVQSARLASLGVASYAETKALPVPNAEALKELAAPTTVRPGQVYLAGPFFTLGQRWLVDEIRRALFEFELDVFSPIHDVGPGPASVVAPEDIKGLEKCDVVVAILDGLDSGTVFEVGYARALGKPVYCIAQTVPPEDLKMIEGSGCKVYTDLVTALHHLAWRA